MGCTSSKQSRYDAEDDSSERPVVHAHDRYTRRAQKEDERNRRAVRAQYGRSQEQWNLGGGVVLEADPAVKGAYKLPNR